MAGGLVGLPAFVGFGSSAQGLTALGATIDITNASGTLSNFAFQVPRAGTITSFSAFFSTTAALSLIGSTAVVTAQIYQSTTPNNVFSPIAGTLINLTPSLTGVISIGTLLNGSLTGLSIPVTARTRLMLVLSASASGLTLLNTIVGYASAGSGITCPAKTPTISRKGGGRKPSALPRLYPFVYHDSVLDSDNDT
nr:exosporium glycoprotein BclB-related protein [uncultured Acetatifactor sp.]